MCPRSSTINSEGVHQCSLGEWITVNIYYIVFSQSLLCVHTVMPTDGVCVNILRNGKGVHKIFEV